MNSEVGTYSGNFEIYGDSVIAKEACVSVNESHNKSIAKTAKTIFSSASVSLLYEVKIKCAASYISSRGRIEGLCTRGRTKRQLKTTKETQRLLQNIVTWFNQRISISDTVWYLLTFHHEFHFSLNDISSSFALESARSYELFQALWHSQIGEISTLDTSIVNVPYQHSIRATLNDILWSLASPLLASWISITSCLLLDMIGLV